MIRNIVIDAVDPDRLADFWADAAGFERGSISGNYITLKSREQRFPQILIQKVSESKPGTKNRVHLDFPSGSPDEMNREIARLEGLGARKLREVTEPDGELFTVLADPEGNEFCVVVE